MNGTIELAGMGEDDVLAFAGARADRIRADKVDLLRAAYQIAVIHNVDGLGPDRDLPGREKARRYGGEDTPEVLEFAAATLAARLGVTTWVAEQLIADALDLHHRTPAFWTLLLDGKVDPDYARLVVKKTRSMRPEAATRVATVMAQYADGRVPWGRFEEILAGAIAAADPEAALAKEQRAAEATFAKKLRNQGQQAPGMGALLAQGPLWGIDQMDATLDSYSRAIAEDFPDLDPDQLRFQALLLLLTPGSDQDVRQALADHAPVVHLYVHTYVGPDASGVARLEGHGPVTEEWVRHRLGAHCRFKIQPVIDIPGMAPVDAYEIPHRHREAVHLMTPADTFPYGSNLSRNKQTDHTIPWDPHGPPGQSGVGNYGPMTTYHHRVKTHGAWKVVQPFRGIYLWQDKHGVTYLVDHTGTRQLRGSASDHPLVVEIYRDLPGTELDWAS